MTKRQFMVAELLDSDFANLLSGGKALPVLLADQVQVGVLEACWRGCCGILPGSKRLDGPAGVTVAVPLSSSVLWA